MILPAQQLAGALLHLAEGGEGIFSLVVLVIIAIIGAAIDRRQKRSTSTPDEIAKAEREQQKRRQAPGQRPADQRLPGYARPVPMNQPSPLQQRTLGSPTAAQSGQPTFLTIDEMRRAEQKARQRVARMGRRKPQPATPTVPTSVAQHADAVARHLANAMPAEAAATAHANPAARRLAERMAHLNELQKGFVYHEIFSQPRAVRQELNSWDA